MTGTRWGFAAVINLIFLVVVDLGERVADYLNRGERSKELCVCVCVCVCVCACACVSICKCVSRVCLSVSD